MKTIRKILSVITVLAIVFSFATIPAAVSAEIVSAQPAGEGTASSPYVITNAEELYWFAALVNGTLNDGTEQNSEAHAVLGNDIIVNKNVVRTDGTLIGTGSSFTQWAPIISYQGVFDGAGHTISGIYYSGSEDYAGLFGYNYSGTIKNVGVIKSYVKNTKYDYAYTGAICGYNGGTITNCYSDATIYHTQGTKNHSNYVGGICGLTRNAIENCYNTGDVFYTTTYGAYVGGIVGRGAAVNCYNIGTITAQVHNVYSVCIGGITGLGSATNCYNNGTVSEGTYAGGICGDGRGVIIKYCYNNGEVKASITQNSYNMTGGICGSSSNSTIEYCYNLGNIQGQYAGGISGYYGTVVGCYNTGEVEGGTYTGQLIGYYGTAQYSYYLDETGKLSATGGAGTATNVSALSAKSFASGYAAWLLNGEYSGGEEWYQNLGEDASPVTDRTHGKVYRGWRHGNNSALAVYENYPLHEDRVDHDNYYDGNGICIICGHNINHNYVNGVCTHCMVSHENHEYQEGKCSVCGLAHTEHTYLGGCCSICGYLHTEHTYQEGMCTVCSYYHEQHEYTEGVCTICGYKHSSHSYENGICIVCKYSHTPHSYLNGVCSECGYMHKSHNYSNGSCTVCGFEHIDHSYENAICAVCGITHINHSYENGECTVCGHWHSAHYYNDGACTICGLPCTHKFENSICSVCNKGCSHCYTDGVCESCGVHKYYVELTAGGGAITGHPGETVSVPVIISNNVGVAGVRFTIKYDNTILTPIDVIAGVDFVCGSMVSNIEQVENIGECTYVTIYWSNPSDITVNGEIANILFKISEDAAEGPTDLVLECENGNITNQQYEEIAAITGNGYIEIENVVAGDVYYDRQVDAKDGVRIAQYLADWELDLSWAESRAADVFSDEIINTKDGVLLSQYLADWDVVLPVSAPKTSFFNTLNGFVSFVVPEVTAQAGGYVDVPVMINSNSGVAGFNLVMNYDAAVLTPISIESGAALTKGNFESNLRQENADIDYVTATWLNASNITDIGEAFVVRFKVAENTEGIFSVTLSCKEGDMSVDQSNNEITTVIDNGDIAITDELPLCNVNKIITEKTDSGIKAYINVSKNTDSKAEVILAAYDAKGAMVFMKHCPVEKSGAQTVVINSENSGEFEKAKVFVWNSLSGAAPLCDITWISKE